SEGGIGGYTDDDWKESETLLFLKNDTAFFKRDYPIFSNANHAVYFFTDRSVLSLPEIVHADQVAAFYKQPTVKLIWFNNEENFDLLTLEELKQKKILIPIKTFNDGSLFLCTSDSSLVKKKF
ncbi:MAG: hypothetical protein KGL19_00710, partial [Bacteroidota bacterium]|nr:hypothetical protein [Bacteroidota bacterium]